MDVSRQHEDLADMPDRGPRARTRRLMLETATRLMQDGSTPSVSEVAEAAEVSRATAYRYFPTQEALVHAVIDEALGPILSWRSASRDAETRTRDLIGTSLPRIGEFEATFRAALKLSLEQWAQSRAGAFEDGPPFKRGHRIELLRDAVRPLRGSVSDEEVERLAQALSLVFGVESLVVLKDIWGLSDDAAQSVAEWAAVALVRAVAGEAAAGRAS